MFRIGSFFAYVAAFGCIAVVLATFIANKPLSEKLVSSTGVKVSPLFTGGDVVRVIDRKGYSLKIHEAVFQGLFSDRDKGFVQIDYIGESIPDYLKDEVDYNNDGKTDFIVSWEKSLKTAEIIPENSSGISLLKIVKIKNGYCLRVNIEKTVKK